MCYLDLKDFFKSVLIGSEHFPTGKHTCSFWIMNLKIHLEVSESRNKSGKNGLKGCKTLISVISD